MKIFQFEQPIADAIKQRFIDEIDESFPDSWKRNLFLSYEPSEGEVFSYATIVNENDVISDGLISVYAEILEVSESSSQTGEQATFNTINVDCYGYGDVLEGATQVQKSTVTAQKRAQVLSSIAYKAIMSATELANDFGTGITIGEKVFIKIEKGSPAGPEKSERTICFYRSQYKIKLEEDIPTETLGVEYDGGSGTQETSNPE